MTAEMTQHTDFLLDVSVSTTESDVSTTRWTGENMQRHRVVQSGQPDSRMGLNIITTFNLLSSFNCERKKTKRLILLRDILSALVLTQIPNDPSPIGLTLEATRVSLCP